MKVKLAVLPFQRSTLLTENHSQNLWNYLQFCNCLKFDIIKNRRNRQKLKKDFFSSYIESPILNTNPNNIKLQMLLQGLKCKQIQGKTIFIIERKLQINNYKVDNGLNDAVIRDN